jgi:DNA topoisomerase I
MNDKKWTVFRHNGPYFPNLYERHNIDIYFNGSKINVPGIVEEYLTLYAKYVGTDYDKNQRFKKNFFNDLRKVLPKEIRANSIDDFNLSEVKKHLDNLSEKRKQLSRETKLKLKEKQELLEMPYKYIIIDGARQKVGNYKIEPPGIFMGRGDHPKLGKIKRRISPEDITINLDKEAKLPTPNVGGKWKKVIHDNNVVWLATWVDEITGKNKYVFTSMESIFKSASDEKKFDLARKLKNKAGGIRKSYGEDLVGDNNSKKQLATALYFIDNFALRVGGKKNTKEKADTVGVTSLRVEHLTLLGTDTIKLDFLGKDSIRYCKKSKVSKEVFDNLNEFIKGKNKKEQLFDKISSSGLNDYLDSFMSGLTAKVWRTYNASNTFQKELNKVNESKLKGMPEQERINYLITFFNQANTTVALLCNHQKAVTTNIDNAVKKIDDMIKKLRNKKRKLTSSKNTNDKKEKINKIDAKIDTLKLKKDTKGKMKNVSLGTSKTNYIDPRIIFSFIKKYEIPEEKLFNKQLITRFEWASKVSKDYSF